jgi:hypothetical protein
LDSDPGTEFQFASDEAAFKEATLAFLELERENIRSDLVSRLLSMGVFGGKNELLFRVQLSLQAYPGTLSTKETSASR